MKASHKDILSLAVPSILANITVPLVGMADIAVAGHLGGSSGAAAGGASAAALIGGITIGTMLFDLLYWNFSFLRSGTGGLTAQAYGAFVMPGPDRASHAAGIKAILLRALRIALISGVALIALQWVVLWLAFLFVDCSPEVRELASHYFKIRVWAAPATLSLFAFKGWFIGLQDTVRPMIADLLVNGLNIALSFGLGFGLCGLPAMGFAGVAAGTLIAQWCGFAYAAFAARHSLDQVQQHPVDQVQAQQSTAPSEPHPVDQVQAPSFFRMNRDLVLRSLGMIAVYIGFTVISAKYGDTMLAVSSILMKLLLVFSYFTDGFAYAGEALTGKFIGARDREGVQSAVRGTFLWGWGLAGAFMLLYGLGGVPAFRLLTSDASVVDAGREFIMWLLLMPIIGVPAFIWDGIFTGATETGAMRNSTLLCAVGFFAVWFGGLWLVGAVSGSAPDGPLAIHILMAAYFVHLAIRSVYLTVVRRRILPVEAEKPVEVK
ncbi:MAG: MATE family efflux transporter [Bacteroidales bacterium]|nr:MATE family efflux transporter [Bacteroidales bacterium]